MALIQDNFKIYENGKRTLIEKENGNMSKEKGHVSKIKRALVRGEKGEGARLLSNRGTCQNKRGTFPM